MIRELPKSAKLSPTNNRTAEDTLMVFRLICMYPEDYPICYDLCPIAWRKEGQKVTLVAMIGGFLSDLSITRMFDENFGNVSAGVMFSKVAYQRKWWYTYLICNAHLFLHTAAEPALRAAVKN